MLAILWPWSLTFLTLATDRTWQVTWSTYSSHLIILSLSVHKLSNDVYRRIPLTTSLQAAANARTAKTRRCAFWGFRWYCSPFWRWNTPKTTIFGGVNRRFQAKRAKYWKFHVIEITEFILTKFGITIETTKGSSWVVPVGAQQIQDDGRPPFWKKRLNRHMSATVPPILMKCANAYVQRRQLRVIHMWEFNH